jgi:hypothetical protein
VIGDARTAGLVALASSDRPSLYLDGSPARAPWLNDEAVRQKGAIVLWTAIDTAGTPPPALKERFPGSGAGSPALVRSLGAGPPAAACASAGR